MTVSATVKVGGINAKQHNPTGQYLSVVGGPCGGQRVRNLSGSPRQVVLCRPGERGIWHDYEWNGVAYVPAVDASA